jgi:hypothetical protein
MLRLATDADVNGAIVRGLRLRIPGIDLIRSQDFLKEGTPEPGSSVVGTRSRPGPHIERPQDDDRLRASSS